jgi:hypothetical protein
MNLPIAKYPLDCLTYPVNDFLKGEATYLPSCPLCGEFFRNDSVAGLGTWIGGNGKSAPNRLPPLSRRRRAIDHHMYHNRFLFAQWYVIRDPAQLVRLIEDAQRRVVAGRIMPYAE